VFRTGGAIAEQVPCGAKEARRHLHEIHDLLFWVPACVSMPSARR
jgi:hypothetical protein